ncbi:MAG: hypothetical protein OEX12_01205 [Gammaproteobacteria bacterium]|nr:hypothetical protein [Gammaproteobacteria bacterium]
MNLANRYSKLRIAVQYLRLRFGYWFAHKIPPPKQVIFREYSELSTALTGRQVRQGFSTVRIRWDNLSREQLFTIKWYVRLALAEDTDLAPEEPQGDGYLYLTIDKLNGSGGEPQWIDIKGIPWIPEPEENSGIQRFPHFPQTELFLNAVEVISDPAIFGNVARLTGPKAIGSAKVEVITSAIVYGPTVSKGTAKLAANATVITP